MKSFQIFRNSSEDEGRVILCKGQIFLLCYHQSVEYTSLPKAAHEMPEPQANPDGVYHAPLYFKGQSLQAPDARYLWSLVVHCEASLKDRQAMLCEYHPGCPQHTAALLLTPHRADYRVDKTTELVPTDVAHTHLAERGQTLPQAAMLREPHTQRALSERPGRQTAHSSPGAQQDPRAPLPPS